MPFGVTYDIINTLAKWSLNSYYSKITISNPHEVPPTGPVIVAANHWNMTIDPAMLSSRMPHGRRLHYWAKNTLFKNPIINFVLLDAGNIPVDRTTRNNQLLFKGTFDVLKLGECVALFPEGTSYTEPKIMQVKDGIAWTALEYAKNLRLTGEELSGSIETAGGMSRAPGEVEDVKVIICGLNYVNKTRYRSSVQVEYSPAITLDQNLVDRFMIDGQEKLAVKELIKNIEVGLKSVTVNSEDWQSIWSATLLRQFLWDDGVGPLHHYRENMQQLVDIMSINKDTPTNLKNLRIDLLEYHNQLNEFQTTHEIFQLVFPTRQARFKLIIELIRSMFIWSLFGFFSLFHLPIYIGAYFGSRLQPGEAESMDQNKIVLGLFSGLATVPIYVTIIARFLLSSCQAEEEGLKPDWSRTIVATIIGLGMVIVIHKVHDGMVDGAYNSWKRLKLCYNLKEDCLDELWDIRERCTESWSSIKLELVESNHPGFLKLISTIDPSSSSSSSSKSSSPKTPASLAGLIDDPPTDSDPLLDDHLVDEKSLLRGKKTL
ncbi:hypothetical protein MJO28_009543 [Puccinia striiformis f. sp. tritici]|uniref:Uncharacterized protein n=1 Tax=Puccinia striiformis f. sp. tritici TaxID=168172 RepID=A0ACC0E902_9BASI|nr:hypothetical protein Pst134EA_017602 [Puccinia striiformis f. sp. tritici]KAH9461294.1 hypothetical protein Pst134EA_017602 [Puccinia striiformis f. sp. tritici]KAI7947635.1 hypothetical protein MJO28_009543 [Puccinia striiformis f. sp. tritici]KAI7950653.1 hypothetical protein MJO29_009327 [Puccinia striiformis f. sp. tritici]